MELLCVLLSESYAENYVVFSIGGEGRTAHKIT